MKRFIELSPAENMLLEVTMAEHRQASEAIERMKQNRFASIAASHPEAKDFQIESREGKLGLVYEVPDENPSVPPVS